MLVPNGTLMATFRCRDSAGTLTAPTGTPTGVLYKNDSATGVTVTVTMSTAVGTATATIPSDAVQGDVFYIEITGTVSGTEDKVRSDPKTVFAAAIPSDVVKISGDADAADNAESFFDGTGYAGTNNTFPKLDAIYNKLPARSYLLGTSESTGQIGVSDLEEIASAVWEDDIVSHATVGTFGGWVQSGLASASALATVSGKIDTIDDLIDTEVAAIKAKTDNLPADPADASDIAAAFSTVNTKLDAIDDFIDTEVAAIKAKTDNLPADPADASDVAASFSTVNSTLATLAGYVDTEVAAIKVVTDRLSGMLVQDGLVYQFTTNALENGTGGGGGGSTYIVVHPGYASRPEKVAGTTIVLYHEETGTVGPIRVQTRSNDTYTDVDLTDFTGLHVVIKDYEMTEIDDISTVTVSGTGNAQFSFPVSTTVTGTVTADTQEEWHYYSLRDTDGVVICTGRLRVREG